MSPDYAMRVIKSASFIEQSVVALLARMSHKQRKRAVPAKNAHRSMLEELGVNEQRSAWLAWGSTVAVFIAAFLLFQIQPMVAKIILPWFGGGASVWTTCMLLFQGLLLGGYIYAHYLVRVRSAGRQAVVHICLIIVALLALPITPGADWQPPDSDHPVWRILALLTVEVGVPFLVLAATSPLIQAWYARAHIGRSPYRLYAVSGAGSLGALLTYPFVFEPAFSLPIQGTIWSVAFVLFSAVCAGIAISMRRVPVLPSGRLDQVSQAQSEAAASTRTSAKLTWILLPALASTMLLAVTNHLCQDIAVIPLLWVAPLALYLLSFILCFAPGRLYRRSWWAWIAALSILALNVSTSGHDVSRLARTWGLGLRIPHVTDHLPLELTAYLGVLFAACMLCHGEVARRRPAPGGLTLFYVMIAAGGAAGGAFVALICPMVFSSYLESNLGLLATFLVAVCLVAVEGRKLSVYRHSWFRAGSMAGIAASILFVGYAQRATTAEGVVASSRSFYGVLSVGEQDPDTPDHIRALYHGRVLHGTQMQRPELRQIPTSYFHARSGVGIALRLMRDWNPSRSTGPGSWDDGGIRTARRSLSVL